MNNIDKKFGIGTGVIIFKDGKILLGKRRGDGFKAGEYSLTGGKVDIGEMLIDCAIRETKEESGLTIKNLKFICVLNTPFYHPRYHNITVIFSADWESGEPIDDESETIGEWQWYDVNNLPEPMFLLSKLGIEAYQSNRKFLDVSEN